ncbi:acyl carrier protein [Empedobacter falsenii]
MENFLEKIKETFEIEDREITIEDNFKNYEEWDSLNKLSLIVMLDEEYGIQISDDKLKDLNTLQDLFDEIQKNIE